MEALLEQLSEQGIWLPVVAASYSTDVHDAVAAIRGGAFDYLCLPLTAEALGRLVDHAMVEAARHIGARRRLVDARQRIGALSKREREVLDWLSEGCSNKAIARTLEISPRTVEIHRANMMDKLGASHAAEAVRLRLEAGLQSEEDGDRAVGGGG
jgi:FixJ family two-component response regulator